MANVIIDHHIKGKLVFNVKSKPDKIKNWWSIKKRSEWKKLVVKTVKNGCTVVDTYLLRMKKFYSKITKAYSQDTISCEMKDALKFYIVMRELNVNRKTCHDKAAFHSAAGTILVVSYVKFCSLKRINDSTTVQHAECNELLHIELFPLIGSTQKYLNLSDEDFDELKNWFWDNFAQQRRSVKSWMAKVIYDEGEENLVFYQTEILNIPGKSCCLHRKNIVF